MTAKVKAMHQGSPSAFALELDLSIYYFCGFKEEIKDHYDIFTV